MFGNKSVQNALKKATPKQLLDALVNANPDLMAQYMAENMREKVIEMWKHRQHKPVGFDQLELRYLDDSGRKYYGFPPGIGMPVNRFTKMRDFEMWMTVGVTPGEIKKIVDAMDVAWVNSLKTKKNHHLLGALITDLRMRSDMVIHTELVFQFLAVQWIREDENPEVFDMTIQDEKVATFKKESNNGNNYFFFVQPELSRWNELYNFTPIEWAHYWNESHQRQNRTKNLMEMILKTESKTSESKPESNSEMKIGTTD